MPREDISKFVVHWTKGESFDEAFHVLLTIVQERRLVGGAGAIRGGYVCVCFTEAPERQFHQVLGRYKPFGIKLSKRWLYGQGGRPVVYQSPPEYDLLAENIRWKHVRYEPDAEQPIDFSWEREWRIRAPTLRLPFSEVQILLPSDEWAASLEAEHLAYEETLIQMRKVAYGERMIIDENPEPLHFKYSVVDFSPLAK